jgi:hypothetical protein
MIVESVMKFVLLAPIRAIPVRSGADGRLRPGVITLLPRDITVSACGEGLMPSMVEISWEGSHYCVFREDLETKADRVMMA